MSIPRTAAEWDGEPDLFRLVKCYRGKAWFQRLRLFAARCCRRVWEEIPPGAPRGAVDAAERYALGQLTLRELDEAGRGARGAVDAASETGEGGRVHGSLGETAALAAWACTLAAERPGLEATAYVLGVVSQRRFAETLRAAGSWAEASRAAKLAYDAEMAQLVLLLREAVGNPLRAVPKP